MKKLSIPDTGWRIWLLTGGLAVAMHTGLLLGLTETATTPQFRVAQELNVTLTSQAEQRIKSTASAVRRSAASTPEKRPVTKVQTERPAPKSERQQEQKQQPSSETTDKADNTEVADRENATGQPVPPMKQANYSADYLNNPLPHYPGAARRHGYEGQVLLNVEVLASGSCGQIAILQSSGYEMLDHAAVKAVRQWHFVPASNGGTPVDHWMHIPIRFSLTKG